MAIERVSWGRFSVQGQFAGTFQERTKHLVLQDGRQVRYEPKGHFVPSCISEASVDQFLLWKALGFPRDFITEADVNTRVTLDQMQQAERSRSF